MAETNTLSGADRVKVHEFKKKLLGPKKRLPKLRAGADPLKDFVRWCGKYEVPAGPRAGSKFKLAPYQIEFAAAVLARNDDGGHLYRTVALAVPRGNAKTATLCLLLCWMILRRQQFGFHVGLLSLTRQNSGESFRQIRQFAVHNKIEELHFVKQPMHIRGPNEQAITMFSTDASSGTSQNLEQIVVDEHDLMKEDDRDLLWQMKTAATKRAGQVISISVRGAVEINPYFDEIQKRFLNKDDSVWYKEYSAGVAGYPVNCSIDDPIILKACNPAIDAKILPLEDVMLASRDALSGGRAAINLFRRVHLCQRVSTDHVSMVVELDDWQDCAVDSSEIDMSGPVYLGWDMAENRSMVCCALYAPNSGSLLAYGAFCETPDFTFEMRSLDDKQGQLYPILRDNGELRAFGEQYTDIPQFVNWIASMHHDLDVVYAGCDLYAYNRLLEALQKSGTGWELHIEVRRKGKGIDGIQQTKDFIFAVEHRRVQWDRTKRLLTNAIRNSKLTFDGEGNPIRHRRVQGPGGRIDALDASRLAISGASAHFIEDSAEMSYLGF